jgi:multiple sugar transport system ATP-binding protein
LAIELDVRGVSKVYARGVRALEDISLRVEPGSSLGILGPSGSGKTTLLRLIAGLDRPTGGAIAFDGRDVTRVPPWERAVSLLGQTPALFPHLSVEANVGLALKGPRWPRERRARRLDALMTELGLAALRKRRPAELSGGERQRVALGRALAPARRLLLLDEPFVSLDRPLRLELRARLAQFQRSERFTLVLVTHDRADAFALTDRIAVVGRGRIEQIDEPARLQSHPMTIDVARFASEPPMSFVRMARVDRERAMAFVPEGAVEQALRLDALTDLASNLMGARETVIAGVVPPAIRLVRDGADVPPGSWVVTAIAQRVEIQGSERWLHATLGRSVLCAQLRQADAVGDGELVRMAIDIEAIHWFDGDTGRSLTRA